MTEPFESLASLLDPDYNPDYWSDVVKSQAAALLRGFDDEDWHRLADACRIKPPSWCRRLAEASYSSGKPQAAALLIEMLKRPEAEVGSSAAAMLLEMDYQWSPHQFLVADLRRHLENASEREAPPISRLLSRLPA